MGSFEQDSSLMDMVDFNSDMTLMPGLEMSVMSDDVTMDMAHPDAVAFDRNGSSTQLNPESDQKVDPQEQPAVTANGVGAGPLPTSFGIQSASSSGSTLTEFTKRRNWCQRVLEEIKDLLYILTPDARVLYLSRSCKALTGYEPSELIGQFLIHHIHPDDSQLFMIEFNESISTGNPLRFYYRLRTKDNKYVIFEVHGHPHLTNDVSHLELTGGPANAAGFCRGFFMMARPYPTKNSELLDSFLEHKIENERLQARIAALKREELEDSEAQMKHGKKGYGLDATPCHSADVTPGSPSLTSRGESAYTGSMPPPAKPTVSNTALTRENLDEANAFARPDSITDKMARYEGSSHVDSIEMLTGLRYRDGERSQGISTGVTSPALIRGDAGISIPADKADSRYGGYLDKKPKKVKSADEYVCTDCGTLDSPEWRKGPSGPKTLCNACGLRWAKKEKKKSGTSIGGNENGGNGGHSNPHSSGTLPLTPTTAHGSIPHS